jgi:hypothetical protein
VGAHRGDHADLHWTRNSARLLGSVLVGVDYSFPVEEGRAALKRIIEGNPLWDLRCQIREKFIDFIRDAHPSSLPLVRAHLQK